MKRSEAFTLIEMLIVITVIAILAGISFRLVQIAGRTSMKAKTIAKLEQLQHALTEFKAEYGVYPPVYLHPCTVHGSCNVCYQYENTNSQPGFVFLHFNAHDESGNLFDMGLVSFLEPRMKGGIYHTTHKEWVPDTDRDKLAKAGWSRFMAGLVSGGSASNTVVGYGYYNNYSTICDSWGGVVHYECPPPHQTYRLWSDGPTSDKKDDIHKDEWDD